MMGPAGDWSQDTSSSRLTATRVLCAGTLRRVAFTIVRDHVARRGTRTVLGALLVLVAMCASAAPAVAQPPKVKLTIRNAKTLVEDRALVVRVSCNKPCRGTLRVRLGRRLAKAVLGTTMRIARGTGARTLRLKFPARVMSAIRVRVVPLYLAQIELQADLRDDRGSLRRTNLFEYLTLHPTCDALAGVVAQSDVVRLAVATSDSNFSSAVACARGSRNLRTIIDDSFDGILRAAVANGPMIAVATTTWPDGDQVGLVYDAVNDRVIRDLANSAAVIRKLVVTPEGHSAYTQVSRLGNATVEADDASGHRILDPGPGIDVTSLRLDGHILTWTNAGEPRSDALG